MKKIILPLICLLLFATCKKEEEEIIIPSITYPTFEGYILTDIDGATLGNQGNDTTDWKLDNSSWLDIEKSLFTNYNNLIHNYNSDFNTSLYYPCPNPTINNIVMFPFNKLDSTISFDVRFVNQQFTKVKDFSFNLSSNNIIFLLDSIQTSNNELVRAYYTFTRNDTCFHKGFGDIMFE